MKKTIPIIIALIIVVAGAAVFLMARNNDDTPTQTTSQGESTNSFNAVSTSGVSFVATITTTTTDGKTVTGVMESDSKNGAVKYTASTAGATTTMIYTKDAFYMCQTADNCIKSSAANASFNPSAYEYSDDELAQFKSSSTKVGTESCPSGTCDVWNVSSEGYQSKIYLDQKTKRVSQVVGGTDQATSTIVYDYKDVTVTIPQNAQEAPSFGAPSN